MYKLEESRTARLDRRGGLVWHRQIIAASLRASGEIRITRADRMHFSEYLRTAEVFDDTETGDLVIRRAKEA